MTTSKLPARPSLESLRKQAKKLARTQQVSLRTAQLILAREYGFPGWKDLIKEIKQRLGTGLDWAISEARRIIHDNDVERLRQLVNEYPALLSCKADEDNSSVLGIATGSFGDSGDPIAEEHFTRYECAVVLLDAGAVVTPRVCEGLLHSRARKLIDLFQRRGLLPRSLKFFAALGEIDEVRAYLDANAGDLAAVNEAFMYACHFEHADVASLLLDRAIRLDAELGKRIDSGPGRSTFIRYFIGNIPGVGDYDSFTPWQAYIQQRIHDAIRDNDLTSFVDLLRRDAWLLSDAYVKFQVDLIELGIVASVKDRTPFLNAFLDLDPAVLHLPVPPASRVYAHAFTYAKAHLVPTLLRIWPLPDDLPHAAGSGDLTRVKRWFDSDGKPALGDLANHFPSQDKWIRGNLGWDEPNVQHVLDTALAWAVMNNHFDIAEFLLDHGADVNTNWCSHEPASILHELVWYKNYEAMQFLIDHGIDMTILDYRWHATAQGWAAVAAKDEKLARFLADARQRRRSR